MGTKLHLLIIFLLTIVAAPVAHAADCSSQFQGGQEPTIEKGKTPTKLHDLCFAEYDVLYSGETFTPIWSAEHLTKGRIQKAKHLKRKDAFHTEGALPVDEQITPDGYGDKRFDRGHMSPSADFSTARRQKECYSMANMVPQVKKDNEQIWSWIENTVRGIALHDNDVYVVTGPIFSKHPGKLHNKIEIPAKIFKAVYVPSVRGAAVYVSNNDDTNNWSEISVADLTAMTGIDPFPGLSHSIKASLYKMPSPSASHGKKKNN